MTNAVEMKTEGANREHITVENRVLLMDVEFSSGEKITVSGNDISIFDRFLSAGKKIEQMAAEMEEEEADTEEERDLEKEIEERKLFSKKAEEIMDGVFGEGTTRKFFGDVYAAIPNFQPDLECFMDFWDSLIPVIERLSEHKIKLEKLASKKRMAKYQPQDHKRKGGK